MKVTFEFLITILICFGLLVTVPTKTKFTEFISKELIQKLKDSSPNSEISTDPLTGNIVKGITTLFLDNAVSEENYYIFKIFTIDLHLLRAFNQNVEDVKFIGIAGQFIPLNKDFLTQNQNAQIVQNQNTPSVNSYQNNQNINNPSVNNSEEVKPIIKDNENITDIKKNENSIDTKDNVVNNQQDDQSHIGTIKNNIFENNDLNLMMDAIYSKDQELLSKEYGKLKLSDKPEPVNKEDSRKYNLEGLTQFKNKNYEEAEKLFTQGYMLNTSDAELVNNIAYAQFKEQKYKDAISNIQKTLLLAPDRSSAWLNLSFILIYDNDNNSSICSSTALGLKFSSNKERSIKIIENMIDAEDNVIIKEKIKQSLECAQTKL